MIAALSGAHEHGQRLTFFYTLCLGDLIVPPPHQLRLWRRRGGDEESSEGENCDRGVHPNCPPVTKHLCTKGHFVSSPALQETFCIRCPSDNNHTLNILQFRK